MRIEGIKKQINAIMDLVCSQCERTSDTSCDYVRNYGQQRCWNFRFFEEKLEEIRNFYKIDSSVAIHMLKEDK
jgi:hypothetical protein